MTFPAGPLCTRDSLVTDLRAAGVAAGQTLLVHASLKSLGWVAGGTVAAVEALREVLGPDGTLVVPTMTGENSDPAHWSAPRSRRSGGTRSGKPRPPTIPTSRHQE